MTINLLLFLTMIKYFLSEHYSILLHFKRLHIIPTYLSGEYYEVQSEYQMVSEYEYADKRF